MAPTGTGITVMTLAERLMARGSWLDPAKLHEIIFRPLRHLPIVRKVQVGTNSLVSVVVATNRPQQLDHVVASFDAQQHPNKELVIVTNSDGFSTVALDELARRSDVTYVQTPKELSLGEALNIGVRASAGQVIAKFDDDDYYGPRYLLDALGAMAHTSAAVVGKKTYFMYLEELDETVKMYPGNEDRRVGRVAGGTILVHRCVFERLEFPAVNLGEDVRFVRAAERRGFAIYGAPARGFLQWRSPSGHTWEIDATHMKQVSQPVGRGLEPELWA